MKKIILIFFLLASFVCSAQLDTVLVNRKVFDVHREYKKNNIESNPINETAKGTPDAVFAPGNDNCVNATVLTIDAGCTGGQTTSAASLQGGECIFGGIDHTTWYRFNTGANTTLNLAWIYTNSPTCCPALIIFGPFNAGAGCLPGCGTVFATLACQNGDPGFHTQITGLTANKDYLIQISTDISPPCFAASDINYCIGLYTQPSNDLNPGTNMNSCGTAFSGNNNGYSPDGTGASKSNLDNNNATTCGTCAAGNDVPYVINNDQWFYFCTVNAGTYNITINNIANCVLSTPNAGIQCSILQGPTTAFTNLYNFPSPMAPGTSNTSSNFVLAAGDCVYMPIDGFAGDQCTYDFTLTNISGGCNILPIELLFFDMKMNKNDINLFWLTASETNCDRYVVQKSTDGMNYMEIGTVISHVNTNVPTRYDFIDKEPNIGMNYYRLLQFDKNGKVNEIGNAIAKFFSKETKNITKVTNITGETVDIDTNGIVFIYYEDGTVVKRVNVK